MERSGYGFQGSNYVDVGLEVVIDRMRVLDHAACYDPVNFKTILGKQRYREIEVKKPGKD